MPTFRLFRPACILAAAMLSFPALHAQKQEIPADLIIPPNLPTFPVADWKDAPGRKAVSFKVGDVDLRGFRYPATTPSDTRPEVLFFNGNGMTVLRTDRVYRALAAMGYTITAYDYRGYGFSGGKTHLADFRDDGLKLYDETLKQAPSHKVVVYGASMGTAMAAYIASERPLVGLILGMPIASADEEFPVFARAVGYPEAMIASSTPSPEAVRIFAERTLVAKSKAPLLVLGGSNDTLVPENQGREILADSPAKPKTFVEVAGAGHNDVILSPAGVKAVEEFLTKLK